MNLTRLAVFGIGFALLIGWYLGSGEDVTAQNYGQQPPPGPAVWTADTATTGTVVTVMASRRPSVVTLAGTVIPYKAVTLTARIPGRVEFVAGTEGERFKNGDLLLSIDDDDLLAQRRAAVAEIGNAAASMANARMQYSRELYSPQGQSIYNKGGMGMPSMFDQMFTEGMTNMVPGNVGGRPWLDRQADLVNRGTQINQAQARALTARSRLEEVDAKLRDTRSIAPFDGVITRKAVEVGDTVQPGQAMLDYTDTQYLQIKVDVPARQMPGLRVGMMVPARLDVGDTRVDARIAQIFPTADAQRHTVTVKFDLPQGVPGGPGMYAEVMVPDIAAPANTLPVIPESAVVWRGSLPGVFVIDHENQTQLRLLRLGDRAGAGLVSVLSGIQIGERIYANPPPGMASSWSRRNEQRN